MTEASTSGEQIFVRSGKAIAVVIVVCIVVLWSFSRASSIANLSATSVLLFILAAHLLSARSYRITVSSSEITEESILRKVVLRWSEVDDILDLPNVVVIKASQQQKIISIFRPSPGNIFHKVNSLEHCDELIKLILVRAVPMLHEVWAAKSRDRIYQMPEPPHSLFAVSMSPILVPLLGLVVFQYPADFDVGHEHLYLFVPFLLLTFYLMWRFRLFSGRRKVIINERGIGLKNGSTSMANWEIISLVRANPKVLGLGSITVYSEHASAMSIPRSIERFSDLVLQIKTRIPDKLDYSAEIGLPSE